MPIFTDEMGGTGVCKLSELVQDESNQTHFKFRAAAQFVFIRVGAR